MALGSPAVCLEWSAGRALAAGASEDEIADVLLAIAPIAGLGRVVAAAPEVPIALGYDIAAALEEPDDEPLPELSLMLDGSASAGRLRALGVLPIGDPSGDTRQMAASMDQGLTPAPLRCGIVLHVQEDACQILRAGQLSSVRFAKPFPSPRAERVSPGHLVAVAAAADGAEAVVWRWYDAVVLGEERGLVRLWEPAHGEVAAHPRRAGLHRQPGTRAYLSAGLPGADWWVAGAAVAMAQDADVELDEVGRFCTEHGLWPGLA